MRAVSVRAAPECSGVSDGRQENLTRMLDRAAGGDRAAAAAILPLVYQQLRAQAQQMLHNERQGHTLQATALVHEAYLRMVGSEASSFAGRAHFYAVAAEAMRRVLIDYARERGAVKRGRDWTRRAASLEDVLASDGGAGLLELDEALVRLRAHEPQAAEIVTMRFFAGMSIDQIADVLGLSARTVDRVWRYARAWLSRELRAVGARVPGGGGNDGSANA